MITNIDANLPWNAEQRQFRDEVRGVVQDYRSDAGAVQDTDPRDLLWRLGARALLAPSWSEDEGGRGLGQVENCIVLEELGACGYSDTLYITTVQVAGSIVRDHAGDALRREVLTAYAAGRRFASVLFSEPGAGSDLAAIVTAGEPDGAGGWRISGRKCWTATAASAHDGICAFRVPGMGGAPQDAIGLVLLDLGAPGVRIETVPGLLDEEFAAVRLDDTHVPGGRVVALPGGGWGALAGSISYERTGFDYLSRARRALGFLYDAGWGGTEAVRTLAARYRALRFHAYEVAEAVDVHGFSDADAALVKLVTSEFARDVAFLLADLGPMVGPEADALLREASALTLSAGASELLVELGGSYLPKTAL